MTKDEILELICAAINDCENAKMQHTAETLNAALAELEKAIPESASDNTLRKILISNGMNSNKAIILTDAPKNVLENWCRSYNNAIENGIPYTTDELKTEWYVKLLVDSEVDDFDNEAIETIGYNEEYDLMMYNS